MPIPVLLTPPMPCCLAEAASPYIALGKSSTFSNRATSVKNEYLPLIRSPHAGDGIRGGTDYRLFRCPSIGTSFLLLINDCGGSGSFKACRPTPRIRRIGA